MNAARILILVAAGVAAVAAAFFVYRSSAGNEPQVVVQQQEAAPTARILAARNGLRAGTRVRAEDLYWQAWPEEALSPAYVVESRDPDARETYSGAIVRAEIAEGEPVTASRLIATGDSSFMAAMLAPGMRAVAVPISAETGAGGFILPNDRVDVIVTFEEEAEGSSRRRFYVAETVVENARVLAIDQIFGNSGDDEDEGAVLGSTATLELAPAQANAVSLAVARGDISLILRSLSDGDGGPRMAALPPRRNEEIERPGRDADDNTIQVYRYGQGRQVALQGD
tara:strand:- start:3396 stop:4244 length:849 start_codon:yes stop_codon:yes gene_type:complete